MMKKQTDQEHITLSWKGITQRFLDRRGPKTNCPFWGILLVNMILDWHIYKGPPICGNLHVGMDSILYDTVDPHVKDCGAMDD